MIAEDLARRLGAVLRCADLEDPFEYRFMFDLTANTFLQKLVPKRLMDRKLDFAPGETFRSLLVLTYATSVFDAGEGLCDNLAVIARELAKIDRKARLPLGLLVTEIALFCAEHDTAGAEPRCKARFDRLDGPRCACDLATLDPYYEAVGFMLADQLANKEAAEKVSSKGELLAVVFADAVLPHVKSDPGAIAARLGDGAYWEASVQSLRALAATVTLADLEEYFTPERLRRSE